MADLRILLIEDDRSITNPDRWLVRDIQLLTDE